MNVGLQFSNLNVVGGSIDVILDVCVIEVELVDLGLHGLFNLFRISEWIILKWIIIECTIFKFECGWWFNWCYIGRVRNGSGTRWFSPIWCIQLIQDFRMVLFIYLYIGFQKMDRYDQWCLLILVLECQCESYLKLLCIDWSGS